MLKPINILLVTILSINHDFIHVFHIWMKHIDQIIFKYFLFSVFFLKNNPTVKMGHRSLFLEILLKLLSLLLLLCCRPIPG